MGGALLVQEGQLRRTRERGGWVRMKHDLEEAKKAFLGAKGLKSVVPRGRNVPNAIVQLENDLNKVKGDFKEAMSNMTKKQKAAAIPVLCEGCGDTGKAPCAEKDCKWNTTTLGITLHTPHFGECTRPCRCQTRYGSLRAGWRVRGKVYYYVKYARQTFPIDSITKAEPCETCEDTGLEENCAKEDCTKKYHDGLHSCGKIWATCTRTCDCEYVQFSDIDDERWEPFDIHFGGPTGRSDWYQNLENMTKYLTD